MRIRDSRVSTRALEGFSSAAAANPRAFKSWTLPNLGQGGLCRRANLMAAISSREDRSPLVSVLDDNGVPTGELEEGDPIATSFRNYPRDIITLNLAAEYPITKK